VPLDLASHDAVFVVFRKPGPPERQVAPLASVTLNGRALGTAWKAPYELDVTDGLKSGANRLEVQVTSLWSNRLIGDHRPGASAPKAWTSFSPFPPNAPLAPSGLMGPATLVELH
jgi:hypothetical protein